MGGRFGKYGDTKRRTNLRRSERLKQKISMKDITTRRKRRPLGKHHATLSKPSLKDPKHSELPKKPQGLYQLDAYREQAGVFRDRHHAGALLADMLWPFRQNFQMILGIPAGGVPVGVVVAERLHIPFDVAVVSKITLPWNSEAGYGAVAFDGTIRLNKSLAARIRLSEREIRTGIDDTAAKVRRRVNILQKTPFSKAFFKKAIVLVDDGLASGFTLLVAVEALKNVGADHIVVAVPTAHNESLDAVLAAADAVFCPNIRSGQRYAVADAYENWTDVKESEVNNILAGSANYSQPKTFHHK